MSSTLTIPSKLRPRPAKGYPPQVFKTRLAELIAAHPSKPTPDAIAAKLEITPATMNKYLSGGSIPLLKALQLAHLLTSHQAGGPWPVEQIWEVRA